MFYCFVRYKKWDNYKDKRYCIYFSFLIANNSCVVDSSKAPFWICKKSAYNLKYIIAIGVAKKYDLPFNIFKKIVIVDASANLAETIKVNIESKFNKKTTNGNAIR